MGLNAGLSAGPPLLSRPGRPALVIGDLGRLRGPVTGVVELPHRMVWLPAADRRFDLGDAYDRTRVYEIVLREAVRADELTTWLDGPTLRSLWPVLLLPRGVRRAWELRHPVPRPGRGEVTVPIEEFQERVARIALAVADRYGFVLGGGLALIAHGTVSRPTADVDLFGPESAPVAAAAGAVRDALVTAGIACDRVAYDSGLADLDDHMVELVAREDGGDGILVSLGRLAISRSPVLLSIGPVMDLRDLIAYKIAALTTRAEVRDYVDAAMFLADHTPAELVAQARRVDPAIEDDDVAAAGRRLDATPDRAFTPYRLSPEAVGTLRARFAAWPR